MIPVAKPKLVDAEFIIPYLKQIDSNRWYSNEGPLLKDFRNRLGELFNCKSSEVTILSSATSALSSLLYSIKEKHNFHNENKYCLMPSWTFVATAAAALNAGFIPYFADVDYESWMLDPDSLIKEVGKIDNIGAIIVTSAFGRPINMKSWIDFSKDTKIPVIIDAAASFDSIIQDKEFLINDVVPIAVSMHATKVFGIGEGGLVLSKDEEINFLLSKIINFGFSGDRSINNFGINAKLSEYSCAVGLATIDNWQKIRSDWEKLTLKYIEQLDKVGIYHDLSSNYFKSTCNIMFDGDLTTTTNQLKKRGIDVRRWWNKGCYFENVYKNFPSLALPNTKKLSDSVLGIPFYLGQKEDEIEFVVSNIKLF